MSNTTNHATSTVVTKINEVPIVIINNGDKRVPIKPICNLLGIDFQKQLERIKTDSILGELYALRYIVGADKKEREMGTIPLKWVFGWLFSINENRVSEDAKPLVLKYKMECYEALYNHFTLQNQFLEERQLKIEQQLEIVEELKGEFSTAKDKLKEANDEMKRVRLFSFEQWRADRMMQKLPFKEFEVVNAEKGGEA